MGITSALLLMLLSSSLMSSSSFASTTIKINNSTSCPLDFSYVESLPWNTTECQVPPEHTKQLCCPTITSLFHVSLASRLNQTSLFFLPNVSAANSCIQDFQSKLNSLSLSSNLSSLCLGAPESWVAGPEICAGIETKRDWIDKIGSSTRLDLYCQPDLTDLSICDACMNAELKVHSQLLSIDGNNSHSTNCLVFTLFYASGVVNRFGPESLGSASCIFWLPIMPNLGSNGKTHKTLVYSLVSGVSALVGVCCLFGLYIWWDRRRKKRGFSVESVDLGVKFSKFNKGSFGFGIRELERATDGFSQKNLIGQGGFGVVYKGTLSDGTVVAVKKIIESDFQGDAEFCKEIEIISSLKHRNLVPLIGCCIAVNKFAKDEEQEEQERHRYIVYDYMPNRSLSDHLFFTDTCSDETNRKPLTWPQRRSIILDVAKGLAYLHFGVKPAIYHRDIKATNILLDSDMRARIADFGLAKQGKEGKSHVTTMVAGTHGYLAPEYALYGQLTDKSDVYSFGVVVLEIISGRRALGLPSPRAHEPFFITDWAWQHVKSGHKEEIFDPVLLRNDVGFSNPRAIMERFVLVGILCAHVMVAFRPNILDALKMLEGDIEVPPIPTRPLMLNHSFSPNCSDNSSSTSTLSCLKSPPQST